MDGLLSGHRDCPRAPADIGPPASARGGGASAAALAEFDNAQTWHTGAQPHTEKKVEATPAANFAHAGRLPSLLCGCVRDGWGGDHRHMVSDITSGLICVAAASQMCAGARRWGGGRCWPCCCHCCHCCSPTPAAGGAAGGPSDASRRAAAAATGGGPAAGGGGPAPSGGWRRRRGGSWWGSVAAARLLGGGRAVRWRQPRGSAGRGVEPGVPRALCRSESAADGGDGRG